MNDETPQPVTVERDLMVAMQDGTLLATDVYRPQGAGPLPVILERTPYDKSGTSRSERSLQDPAPWTRARLATWFAARGFTVVMQDCRGRYRSQGEFVKYVNEAADGRDTLAWITAQPWCNGRVGTMGLSYGAHTQFALASLAPPGLACLFADSGGFASAYHAGIRRGGAFELKQATWAHRHALLSPRTQSDPARRAALLARPLEDWFREMPWTPGHSPLAAAPEYEAYLFKQWQAGLFNADWRRPGLYAQGYYGAMPDIPVAIVGSWYDPYASTCITHYTELSRRKRSPVTLLMGPWTHGDRSSTTAGEVDFGADSTLDGNIATDYRELRLAWFRRWLKDEGAAAPARPVTWFQMGGGSGARDASGSLQHGGRWRQGDAWPPAGVETEDWQLLASGLLSRHKPITVGGYREFRYDPADPVPTIGGSLTSGEPVMEGGAFDQRVREGVFSYRLPRQDGPLAERPDVLVFQTPPLTEDLIVTGGVEVELWVGSDCPDTDFTVKLVDVYPVSADWPEGFAMNITDGIFRMRYHEGWDREAFLKPGQAYRIVVRPFATSNLFRKGHRLRLDISGSNYPHFDLNRNNGGPEGNALPARVATNRVYCSALHPSRLRLPVLRD